MNAHVCEYKNNCKNPIIKERIERVSCPKSEEYIILLNSQEAGFISIEPYDNGIFISEIYILKNFRKKKLATQLLDYANQIAHFKNKNEVTLKPFSLDETEMSTKDLISWYHRNGFDTLKKTLTRDDHG